MIMNVRKTKEIIFDFRKIKNVMTPLRIRNEDVEIVNEYRYIGTYIDKDLNWNSNIQKMCGKANQGLYFNVDRDMFYSTRV